MPRDPMIRKMRLHESNTELELQEGCKRMAGCPSYADSTCEVWPFGWFTLSVKPVWTGESHSELHKGGPDSELLFAASVKSHLNLKQ